jgi:hypothetical protein
MIIVAVKFQNWWSVKAIKNDVATNNNLNVPPIVKNFLE